MSNPRIISLTALALTLVVAGLTACGSDEPQGAGAGGSANSPSVAGDSGAGSGGRYGGGSGYGTGGGGGGQDATADADVMAKASNYQFTPSTIDIDHGQVLGLTNSETSTPHTFTVDGQDIDVTLDPGSTATVTVDLAPGRYPFRCRFHASQGMKGTLVVA